MSRSFALFSLVFSLLTGSAFAATVTPENPAAAFEPVDGAMGMIAGASPVKDMIMSFHQNLLYMCFGISCFVLALLLYTVVRYNKRIQKVPATTTHNTMLEVVWTAIPVIILIIIAIPSFKLLYFQERFPPTELTLKVTGHQWYWSYEYVDKNIAFDARGLWDTPQTTDADARKAADEDRVNWLVNNGDPRRLLETDNRVVVPVDTNVRVQMTGADVIHSWAMPAFGVKRDANPGKLNETWFRAEKEGVYYGQCSEICGTGHGYMPIAVEVVSKEKFAAWLEAAKKRFAANAPTTIIAQR